MTIRAHVVDVHDNGKTADLGVFEFAAAPGAGDQVVVKGEAGSLAVYRVNFVEHDPVALPRSETATHEPRLTAFVTRVGDVA